VQKSEETNRSYPVFALDGAKVRLPVIMPILTGLGEFRR
jgi:hypothetical protein